MKGKYLLLWSIFLKPDCLILDVNGHCIDIHSNIISQGLHYVPGTNPCLLCICDKGAPKWCKSVLCSPPQNCKSFQVGNSCCEFKCLDDILSGHDTYKETYDVALRFIASTVTVVLSISLLFFLYNRLKRNNVFAHNHQRDDQRNNVGYIASNFGYTQHNLGYLGACNNELEIRYEETSMNFSLWKPPDNYFPNGEAPPPYEEAMRTAQNEILTNQINNTAHNTLINSFSCSYPQEINPVVTCRHEEDNNATNVVTLSSNTHQYVNVNTPLVEAAPKRTENKEAAYENIKVLCIERANRPTGSGPSKNPHHRARSRDVPKHHEQLEQTSKTAEHCYKIKIEPYEGNTKNIRVGYKKSLHRTLPKNLRELLSNAEKSETAYNDREIPSSSSRSTRAEPELGKRESERAKRNPACGNRELEHLRRDPEHGKRDGEHAKRDSEHAKRDAEHAKRDAEHAKRDPEHAKRDVEHAKRDQEHAKRDLEHAKRDLEYAKRDLEQAKRDAEYAKRDLEPGKRDAEPQVKKEKKNVVYHSLSQDEEDYRSECENCKTVIASIDEDSELGNETMSLQRRPLTELGYELNYRTSLTLPSNTNTKKTRTYPNASNREPWFSTMQQSSSDESD